MGRAFPGTLYSVNGKKDIFITSWTVITNAINIIVTCGCWPVRAPVASLWFGVQKVKFFFSD